MYIPLVTEGSLADYIQKTSYSLFHQMHPKVHPNLHTVKEFPALQVLHYGFRFQVFAMYL